MLPVSIIIEETAYEHGRLEERRRNINQRHTLCRAKAVRLSCSRFYSYAQTGMQALRITCSQVMAGGYMLRQIGESMNLIFDIGMYDGSDTKYYLSEGYKVIAVEANSNLIERARESFKEELSYSQLVLVNAAICNDPGEEVTLTISGDDLGASSIIGERISHRNPLCSYKVRSMTLIELIEKYGRPYFMKIDIEGADRYCILPPDEENRPKYISFEAGDDIEELVHHLKKIGYTKFKAINQCNFNELNNQEDLIFRAKRKIIHLLGYSEPRYVKRNGRFFLLGHSAGPAPWVSNGKWQDLNEFLAKWKLVVSKNELGGWYDVHAM